MRDSRPPGTAPGQLFTAIQVARGIAAALVVYFHCSAAIGAEKYMNVDGFSAVFRFGSSGVEFFFVLSGFIISTAHWEDIGQPRAALSFLIKRAIRLYPAYWFVLAIITLAGVMIPALAWFTGLDASTLLKTLLLLPQDRYVVGGTGAPGVIVAWTLQYEWLFYILFFAFILHWSVGAVMSLGLIAMIVPHAFDASIKLPPFGFLGWQYFPLFGLGVVVSRWFQVLTGRQAEWLLGAGLALFFMVAITEDVRFAYAAGVAPAKTAVETLGYGLASAMIVSGLARLEVLGKIAASARWRIFGDSSYVVYLIHFPLISLLMKGMLGFGLVSPMWAFVAFMGIPPLCIAAGMWLHVVFEKPVLRWLRACIITAPSSVPQSIPH